MGEHVLSNPKLWLGGYALSGAHRSLAFRFGAEAVDVTAFGDTTRARLAGLKTLSFQHEGFWDADAGAASPDALLFANVALADVLGSFTAEGGDEGEIAYFAQLLHTEYSHGGPVGEAHPFSVAGESSGQYGLLRGIVGANRTAIAATGQSSGYNHGAVGAAQSLYAGLHVLGAGGTPTLDVTIESDSADTWLSPTTRLTFSQATAIGSQFATPVAGAITDTWWRVTWTVGGGTPDLDFIVVLAIQ